MKQIEKNGKTYTEGDTNKKVVKCKGIVDGVKHNITLGIGQGTLYISKGTYEYLCTECYQTRNNKAMNPIVTETLKPKKEKKIPSFTFIEFYLQAKDIRIAELIQTGHAIKNYGSMVKVTSPAYPNLNGIRNSYRKMGLIEKKCTMEFSIGIGLFPIQHKGTISECIDESIRLHKELEKACR